MKSEFTAPLDWVPNPAFAHALGNFPPVAQQMDYRHGNLWRHRAMPPWQPWCHAAQAEPLMPLPARTDVERPFLGSDCDCDCTIDSRLYSIPAQFWQRSAGATAGRDGRELYAMLLSKSMGFHDLHPTGEVMARRK